MDDLPKRIHMRVPMRDYTKIMQLSMVAERMKSNKEFRKVLRDVIKETTEALPSDANIPSVDSLMNILIRLPSLETNISNPPAKRNGPKTMYFTDPQPSTKSVKALYKAVKDTDVKIRHDQRNETCPADVRAMFYAYIRDRDLVSDDEITIDTFLKKLAPSTLKGISSIERKDSSKIWNLCAEIRSG